MTNVEGVKTYYFMIRNSVFDIQYSYQFSFLKNCFHR